MVPFAGYTMPVQFSEGIIAEHLHTRTHAGLFDVSHMGQIQVAGPEAVRELEALMPVDLEGLALGGARYSLLTNNRGGVLDDLIITRLAAQRFLLVVNGACKAEDELVIRAGCPESEVTVLGDRALLALQGPAAREVLQSHVPGIDDLVFMRAAEVTIEGVAGLVSCSGYTGEDGFEISLPAAGAGPGPGHLPPAGRSQIHPPRCSPSNSPGRQHLRW